jgi:hypothetical protein
MNNANPTRTYPTPAPITDGQRAYLESLERYGVNEGYQCLTRIESASLLRLRALLAASHV